VTVAAVILASRDTDRGAPAVADGGAPDGRSVDVRRLVDAAWSGGATPIIVVAEAAPGLAAALDGTPARIVDPGPHGTGFIAAAAAGSLAGATAVLVWPGAMAWVDPETITSLIEGHGADATAILRPSFDGEAGWPALVPVEHARGLRGLDAVPAEGRGGGADEVVRLAVERGATVRLLDLGDPGAVHDRATPRERMPAYVGPREPVSGPPAEWEAAVADPIPDQLEDA
jgi:CTP:molybdopterin cytidylyltransferase MocA